MTHIEAVHFPGYSLLLAPEPHVCGACDTEQYVFINRAGTSVCYTCAEEEERR